MPAHGRWGIDLSSKLKKDQQSEGFGARIRPFSAFINAVRFLGNIQETRHFFAMTDAIDGAQNECNYQRYLKTDVGAKLDAEGVNFADLLSDHEYLNSFAYSSLASAYMNFLHRENLNLELLTQAEEDAGVVSLRLDRSRQNYKLAGTANHDLLHVLTEYGRDPLGEALLLILTAQQFKLRGILIIAHILAFREQILHPSWPVLKMVKEARAAASQMVWIAEIDWRDYLPMRVEAAREELKILSPQTYLKHCRRDVKGSDKEPPEASLREPWHRRAA